jgi:hypothetical protein
MNDPDPSQAASREDLAECLRHLHVRADTPSLRELEHQTRHAGELLPGTHLKQVRLGRTNLNDVLRGRIFPKKAFLLTLAQELNVDLKADRRWEQAWDRLAVQYLDQAAEVETEQLRQLADAKAQADRADQETKRLRRQLADAKAKLGRAGKEAEGLRQQLADAEDLIRQQTAAAEAAGTRADLAAREAGELRKQLAKAEEHLQQGMATGGVSAVAKFSAPSRRVIESGPDKVRAPEEAARDQLAQDDHRTPLFDAVLAEHALRIAAAPALTRRELDVLTSLCRPVLSGEASAMPATAHEIAAELVVTEAAVKQHLLRLYRKFRMPEGPDRRTGLANKVIVLGLVTSMSPTDLGEAPGAPEQPDGRRRDQSPKRRQRSQVPTAPTADPETIADRLSRLSSTEATQIVKTLDPDLAEAVLDLLGTRRTGHHPAPHVKTHTPKAIP